MLSRYVVHVFSVCFRDCSSCPYYYWYHFSFHIPCALNFSSRSSYCRIILASFFNIFLSPKIATTIKTHVPFFVITDYNVQFIVRDVSVGLHWLFPQYGCLTFRPFSVDFGTWSYQCSFIIIIIIIITIIIIIIISFMQGIYTYIPVTNYVPRESSVAAILLLLS